MHTWIVTRKAMRSGKVFTLQVEASTKVNAQALVMVILSDAGLGMTSHISTSRV